VIFIFQYKVQAPPFTVLQTDLTDSRPWLASEEGGGKVVIFCVSVDQIRRHRLFSNPELAVMIRIEMPPELPGMVAVYNIARCGMIEPDIFSIIRIWV
jgi:hypothetical protein